MGRDIAMTNDYLPEIHALWVGNSLKESDIACLESFTRHGHAVYLHVYEPIQNLPKISPIQVIDASKIIPEEKVIPFIQGKRLALFSDIFRFLLLASFKEKGQCIWVDCDVYCLRPLTIPEHGYLFGYQDVDCSKVNGAVLALPPESEMLRTILKEFRSDKIFGGLFASWIHKIILWCTKQLQAEIDFTHVDWEVYGPGILTRLVNKLKLHAYCQSYDVFYPTPWQEATKFANSSYKLADLITQNTVAVHLFNEVLTRSDAYHNLSEESVVGKMIRGKLI